LSRLEVQVPVITLFRYLEENLQSDLAADSIPTISGQIQRSGLGLPHQAWKPEEDQPSGRQQKNYFLSQLIFKTGGVTIITFLLLSVFSIAIQKLELTCLVPVFMKLYCLLINLAWYWVSVDERIREASDKKILSIVSCLCYCFQFQQIDL
jgi:hypothetical protein